MEQIEKALGKKIIRIETNDLDEMEEVSVYIYPPDTLTLIVRRK